ncbi:MAG: XrtA system polysaccharide deacetylase [Pseudomonadota bacterium]
MIRDRIVNALTFDIEEYFQVSAFETVINRDEWDRWESRVDFATNRILDLLAEHSTKATFFTLGLVAEKHPALIRRIIGDGHELACHGYQHVRITQQTREEFRADVEHAKAILEDVSGVSLEGYRAASFSINKSNFWAFNEIADAGFAYSSSVYPVKHDLYGIPDAPRVPFKPVENVNLVEIPVSTVRLFDRNFPAGGGGYFRLYPYAVTKRLIRTIHNCEGTSANMYFHPWEFDPEQPRPEGVSAKSRFRHYLNQGKSLERLGRLLRDFSWSTMGEVYRSSILSDAA